MKIKCNTVSLFTLCVIILLIYSIPCACADEYASNSDITERMNQLKAYFPADGGHYWSGGKTQSELIAAVERGNWTQSALGVTTTGCKHNSKTACSCHGYICTSNTFGGGTQCYGFAQFMGFLLWPELGVPNYLNTYNGYSWTKVTGSNITSVTLEPGDIICQSPSIHSAIVYNVSGSTVTVAEVWGNHSTAVNQKNHGSPVGCQIAWGYYNGNSSNASMSTILNLVKNSGGYILKHPNSDIPIDAAHFPDIHFREYVASNIDTDKNGVLSDDERNKVTVLDVSEREISSLQGIELFPALWDLECDYNSLTSLDVSGCTALFNLSCYGNQLTSLDVSRCTALNVLQCGGNQLTSLDVSGCTALIGLHCRENQLTSLDVRRCTALKRLECTFNQLTSLDVSACTALIQLSCDDNQLTSLDVSACTALKWLSCGGNQFTSLDVSACTDLESLDCGDNQLTSLDMRRCTALTGLQCGGNQLTSLDVSGCTALTLLYCDDNQLTSLDVRHCTALKWLHCGDNQFTSLDVSACTALTEVWCNGNQLTSLDVRRCTALTSLDCTDNLLTSLDVSACTALIDLHCRYNQLTSLDVRRCTALTRLGCGSNLLTSLDVSNCANLQELNCHYNELEVTAVNGCFDLSTLPGFDVTKASNWSGGTVSGTILTIPASGRVTYTYDCGRGFSETFTLNVTVTGKENQYTVAYNANTKDTVSNMPGSQTKTHGVALTLSSNIPTRTGYTFQGWATTATATSAEYQPGGSYTKDQSITLYAVWKANSYTVAYNPNTTDAVSNMPENQTKTHGVNLTLSSNIPTRTGYTFQGWATSATATSAEYQPGDSYTQDKDVTLYAVWKENTYTVTYDANTTDAVSNMPENQTKMHSVALTLSSNKPTRTGCAFQGWATSATATTAEYQPGDSYTKDQSVTLYAVWKENSYTVTYDANTTDAVSNMPEDQAKTHGVPLTLSTNRPTRAGYTFLGWATSAKAAKATYQPGGKYTKNQSVTLYAVWKGNTYTVTYDANTTAKVSNMPAKQMKTHGVDLTLSTKKPTRSGCTFLGWATSATATSPEYQPGDKYTQNVAVTLYALWKESTYTVTYNANTTDDVSNMPENQTKTHGVALTLSSNRPTRAGYTFLGWATSAKATKATYQPGGKYTKDKTVTLYAVWKGSQYTVTYNANTTAKVSKMPGKQMKTHGVALTLSTKKPTRSGCTFLGWATSPTATSPEYQPGGKYTQNAAVTLYALWKESSYTVTYNANTTDAVGNMPENQTKAHGVALTLPSNRPTRAGYTFQGWATSAKASKGTYQPGGKYTKDKAVTLYAVWKKDQYTVTYNANTTDKVKNLPGKQTKIHDTALTLSKKKPTRTGYTFLGWATSPTADSPEYQPGDRYTQNTAVTLYAVWRSNNAGNQSFHAAVWR